jgi:6,7-dimethyl-8-ribityllumazine synthase
MGETFQGELKGEGLRIALAVSRFNEHVTLKLLEGAREALAAHGVRDEDADVAWVPGAFELPLVARRLAESGRYDAVVCIGAVIRGETAHFDFVAGEAARGIADAARDTGVPVMFGVITTENLQQALDRAGGKAGNRGYDAVVSAIETADLLRRLRAD